MNWLARARYTLASATVLSLLAAFGPVQVSSALPASENAPAAVPSVRDEGDAPPQYDLALLRLYRNFKGWQVAQLYSDTWRVGPKFNGIEVFYDTRGGSAPDYRVTIGFTNDDDNFKHFALYRLAGKRSFRVNCSNLRSKAGKDGRKIEVYVARTCMATSKKIGIRATTWDFTRFKNGWPSKGYSDVAPNRGWLR